MEFMREGLLALLELLLNLSLQGSFCILLVLLARFLLRKAPRWCSYVLWSVVFLRLICPVFPEGSFSLMPRQLQINRELVLEQVQEERAEHTVTGSILATEDIVADKTLVDAITGSDLSEKGSAQTGIEGNDINQSDVLQGSKLPNVIDTSADSERAMIRHESAYVLNTVGSSNEDVQGQEQAEAAFDRNAMDKLFLGMVMVWLLGAIAFAAYHIISYQLLKHRMKTAVETQDGIFEVQGEHLSFVMGMVKPKIYLSEGLDAETRKVILCHERVHLHRKDYIFKPMALGICCLHWWNPLVWLAFYLMNKDCEMSCDEKVVALLGEESKTVYSYALLSEATRGEYQLARRGSVCALLSFGEDHVKNRISHVLKYKKASIGVICLAVLVLVVLGVGLCSNPKGEEVSEDVTDTVSEEQAEALKAIEEDLEAQQEIDKLKEFVETDEFGEIALALEKYACAFAERDGNALFELAGDKVAFGMWDMVYPQEDGTYAFGESSPWVRDWTTIVRTEDTNTATIRFIMENSVPEYYIAEETVKLTPTENGYFVDHVEYKLYSEINSVAEMEDVYEWTNGEAVEEDDSQKQYNAREIYDSCEVGDVTYQLTNMGIYRQDSEGYTFLYPTYAADTAKLAYDDGKLYFPTDSSYNSGALDWWDDSIAVLDIETLVMSYIKLPQSAHSVFPLSRLYVRDGYISMWQEGTAQSYCMLLEDVLPVYGGKLATELSEDEKNAYGKKISEQVRGNSNQIYRVGLHTQSTTFAYLDLNSDGKVEEVRMSKHGIGYDAPMDSFILTAGEGKQTCQAMNQVNEIYAWSPDGERIFIILYQDGPSGDPLSTFYRYEDNRLQEAGTIESDVRTASIKNGVVSTVIRRDVIQTDGIRVQYCINDKDEVELIEQETYDFIGLNDVKLKEVLKLYAEPDGSVDMILEMKSQTVHITKTDKNFEWVLIEGIDGTQGWVRVKDIIYVGDDEVPSDILFEGLHFAG